MKLMALSLLLALIGPLVLAEASYSCVELDRVSVSAEGRMSPAFPGRILNFSIEGQNLKGDGVFFRTAITSRPMAHQGFVHVLTLRNGMICTGSMQEFCFTPRLLTIDQSLSFSRKLFPARLLSSIED